MFSLYHDRDLCCEMGKVKEESNSSSAAGLKCQASGRRYVPYRTRLKIFKGRQEGLEKAIFECNKPELAVQFKITLKELALFVERIQGW